MIFNSAIANSQISSGGIPYGFGLKRSLKSTKHIPVYELKLLNKNKALLEDSIQSNPLRYSIFEEVKM